MKPKVFGVGMCRTGTTSLNRALQILGWDAIHFPRDIVEIDRHEAATDMTVMVRTRELALMYPDAKFIWTTRKKAGWLESCRRHFAVRPTGPVAQEIMFRVFGRMDFDELVWNACELVWRFHVHSVLKGFYNSRFLILNICDGGDGGEVWPQLCAFLDVPIPDCPFPWENKGR